jgi:hypothetical protein
MSVDWGRPERPAVGQSDAISPKRTLVRYRSSSARCGAKPALPCGHEVRPIVERKKSDTDSATVRRKSLSEN